jgi:hypothetical protein
MIILGLLLLPRMIPGVDPVGAYFSSTVYPVANLLLGVQ